MKFVKPLLAALIFILLSVYFTYYFAVTLQYLHLSPQSIIAVFISSPFNMSSEGHLLYNLYIPALLIFAIGIYLKNFNKSFQRKANLRSIFLLSIVASYIKSLVSMQYYVGYQNYGISLGTSIITLSFIAAFVVSLEVYIINKETYGHIYGRFVFSILSVLLLLIAFFTFVSFFINTSSFLVHLIGLLAFLVMFIPYYERSNIRRFIHEEERKFSKSKKGGKNQD